MTCAEPSYSTAIRPGSLTWLQRVPRSPPDRPVRTRLLCVRHSSERGSVSRLDESPTRQVGGEIAQFRICFGVQCARERCEVGVRALAGILARGAAGDLERP